MTKLKYFNILLFISMLHFSIKLEGTKKMSQIIFTPEQLQFINQVFDKSEEKKYGKSSKSLNYVDCR